MANAEDIAQVKQEITAKINSVSGNIKSINNFTQSLKLALKFIATKITELKTQGAKGQERAQQLYEELNAILDQLKGIDQVSPDFVDSINSIILLANQEKPNDQSDIPELSLSVQSGGKKFKKMKKSKKSKKMKKSRKSKKMKKSRKSKKMKKSRKSKKMKKGGYRYNKKIISKKKSLRKKIKS